MKNSQVLTKFRQSIEPEAVGSLMLEVGAKTLKLTTTLKGHPIGPPTGVLTIQQGQTEEEAYEEYVQKYG